MSEARPGGSFAARLLEWFDAHGRHDLPWQHPRSAYRVWISEVMLQQTQVQTVVPYFLRFVARFPDVAALAAATLDDVLLHWAGLGYYARARNLHRAAQLLVTQHKGELPRDFEALLALPGIGRSTAGAIAAIAYGESRAILDGNVRRVLARHTAEAAWPGLPAAAQRLWEASEARLPRSRLADYTQAIMDLGAGICIARAPACGLCPVSADCAAHLLGRATTLPAPRPQRSRPLRRAWALLVENPAGEILLERRPPIGIWGGLWCLPLIEDGADATQTLAQRYGVRALRQETLPVLRHAFTHFELELTPLRIEAAADTDSLRDAAGQRWIRLGESLPALPAPIGRLLRQFGPPASPALSSNSSIHQDPEQPCPEPSTA